MTKIVWLVETGRGAQFQRAGLKTSKATIFWSILGLKNALV
jgi:hypothetical protein